MAEITIASSPSTTSPICSPSIGDSIGRRCPSTATPSISGAATASRGIAARLSATSASRLARWPSSTPIEFGRAGP
jgi:hypothetical protein